MSKGILPNICTLKIIKNFNDCTVFCAIYLLFVLCNIIKYYCRCYLYNIYKCRIKQKTETLIKIKFNCLNLYIIIIIAETITKMSLKYIFDLIYWLEHLYNYITACNSIYSVMLNTFNY